MPIGRRQRQLNINKTKKREEAVALCLVSDSISQPVRLEWPNQEHESSSPHTCSL